MAMAKCKECGRSVSTLAKTCPGCGVPNPTKGIKKEKVSSKTKKIYKKENSIGIKEYILDHWEGNFSLVKSFWINGFLLNIIFAIPLIYAEMSIDGISETASIFFLLYILFYVVYFVWVNVGIWKSSGNYIANRQNSRLWGYAARVAVILSVLRAVGESIRGFLV